MALDFLIVDDSPLMRTFIRKSLHLTGLAIRNCFEAGNGEDALRVLQHHPVDMIFTDINMPRMNGEELVTELDAHERFRTIPVIVVSTDSSSRRVHRLMALGVKGYISKPFHPALLRDEVQKIVGVCHD